MARRLKYGIQSGSKYGNHKSEYDGIVFDSKREARRYLYLKMELERGNIKDLKLQEPYLLIESQYLPTGEFYKRGEKKGQPKLFCAEKECVYKADFVYTRTETGELVVEDAKGMRTKEYVIKRKLMLKIHGIRIREV